MALSEIGGASDGAVAAIGKAFDQHAEASSDVVGAFRPAKESATTDFSQASRDLASAFAGMMQADAASSAQIAVLKTVDEMAGTLTSILDQREK